MKSTRNSVIVCGSAVLLVALHSFSASGSPRTYDINILLDQPHPFSTESNATTLPKSSTFRPPPSREEPKPYRQPPWPSHAVNQPPVAESPPARTAQTTASPSKKAFLVFEDFTEPCAGGCAISAFAGIFAIDGISKSTPFPDDLAGADWGEGGIVALAASRRLVRFGDYLQVEGDIGVAKRFGNLTSPEVWAAFYFRWMAFPWNNYLITSIAMSTGLNYAFENEGLERKRAKNGGQGSRLMHYLSPEMTFALPSHPNRVVFVRFHHRSGAGFVFPGLSELLFHDSVSGADYLTIGFRRKF